MNPSLQQQIQAVCDELHHDPLDSDAFDRLRRLFGAAAEVSHDTWRRLVRIACDELYDDPESTDARDRLLLLLAAGGAVTA